MAFSKHSLPWTLTAGLVSAPPAAAIEKQMEMAAHKATEARQHA